MQPSPSAPAAPSVYAVLCDRPDAPAPMALTKATLIALSHALEDECAAGEADAVLFGAFQHARFYAGSRRRWAQLAEEARAAYVFTSGTDTSLDADTLPGAGAVRPVVLPAGSPLLQEWSVVVDGAAQPAALAAWERPNQEGTPDRDRVFDALWTLRPALVRAAARTLADVAEVCGVPQASRDLDRLDATSGAPTARSGASDRVYGRVLQVLTDHQLVASGRPSE